MMKYRIVSLGLCALAMASMGFLYGCKDTGSGGSGGSGAQGNTVEGDTVLIGLVASMNGALRPWGVDCEKGARLAVDEFNEAGGLDGKMIELKLEDSNSRAEDGKTATEKLAAGGAVAIVGEVASGITEQMKIVAVEKGIPLVAVGATNPNITIDTNGLVSRVCYTDDLQGPVMAKFAYDELKLRNVAVITDQAQTYSQGLSRAFKESFEGLGGTIVTEEFYESGQTQFTGQITNIRSKNPDGIFMSGYFNEVGPMARQIRDAGLRTVKLMGGDGWDSSQLVSSGGEAIIGGYFCNHYSNDENRAEVTDFLAKWKAAYPEEGGAPATTMGALGYDAMKLVLDALKRASTKDSKGIAAAINETVDFAGVSGAITLKDQNGDPPKRALVVEVQRDGWKFAKAYEPNEVE